LDNSQGPSYTDDSAEKPLRSSFESLRANGGWVEIIGEFPFMLSEVDHGDIAEQTEDTRIDHRRAR
jgi:hypothetical protein